MTDETADVCLNTNKNKLLFVCAGPDSKFTVHEDFIGLRPVVWTTADEIVGVIKVRFLCDKY